MMGSQIKESLVLIKQPPLILITDTSTDTDTNLIQCITFFKTIPA